MTDFITQKMHDYYAGTFAIHGANAKGVDWSDEQELAVRYGKMLAVTKKDFATLPETPSLLDVGCGWGGLLRHARSLGVKVDYTGIDVIAAMVEHGRKEFPDAIFMQQDIFELDQNLTYDFVVANGVFTQKHEISIMDMEEFTRRMIHKMYQTCKHGIAFNMMSTRVNFMAPNLFYQDPSILLSWLLAEISPRIRLDHGYSSLHSGKGKFYDFTVYVYKD
jgi:2-polyprenyl-3-methyl-5-hydroxy-6-metoxy-1,4-benzoquinol methylase